MAIIDNPIVVGGGGAVDQDSALKYMLEHKTNYAGIAAGLTTLTELPTFTQPSGVRVFSSMFDGCSSLTTVPVLTYPDVATDLRRMFYGCASLTSVPYVDISRSSSLESMFEGCTNMSGTFTGSKSQGTAVDASKMFQNCRELQGVSITRNGAGLQRIGYICYRCSELLSASIGVTPSSGQGAELHNAFRSCTKLTTVDISCQTSGFPVWSIYSLFQDCTSLTSITFGGPVNCNYCSSLASVFYNCSSLVTLGSLQLTNTGNVTNVSNMFRGCTLLTDIPQLDLQSVSSNASGFITSCPSLSNTSLNNVMGSLLTMAAYTGTKTLKYIGFSSTQATTATSLSNWPALSAAGWTTGY